jgi:hypothetical protein
MSNKRNALNATDEMQSTEIVLNANKFILEAERALRQLVEQPQFGLLVEDLSNPSKWPLESLQADLRLPYTSSKMLGNKITKQEFELYKDNAEILEIVNRPFFNAVAREYIKRMETLNPSALEDWKKKLREEVGDIQVSNEELADLALFYRTVFLLNRFLPGNQNKKKIINIAVDLEGSGRSGNCLFGGNAGAAAELRHLIFHKVTKTKPRVRINQPTVADDNEATRMDDGNATPSPTVDILPFTILSKNPISSSLNSCQSSFSSSALSSSLSPVGGSRLFVTPEKLTPASFNVVKDVEDGSESAMELVAALPRFMVNEYKNQNLSFDPETIFKNDVDLIVIGDDTDDDKNDDAAGDADAYDFWSLQSMNEQFADITILSNDSASSSFHSYQSSSSSLSSSFLSLSPFRGSDLFMTPEQLTPTYDIDQIIGDDEDNMAVEEEFDYDPVFHC